MKASDLKRLQEISSGYRIAYNGVNGAANAMKAGEKIKEIEEIIEAKKKLLDEQKEELYKLFTQQRNKL